MYAWILIIIFIKIFKRFGEVWPLQLLIKICQQIVINNEFKKIMNSLEIYM
jgi:hypothetical protein